MDVPVITLAGDHHASRLGVSILSALGLDTWIARDRAEYIARALRASGERAQLQALRATLRARLQGSPLCGRRVARAIEAAALAYFRRWARDHA
jgi:protein O-GlcNAc transferase